MIKCKSKKSFQSYRKFLFVFFLAISFICFSQNQSGDFASDSICSEIKKERQLIPGNTMGEKLESVLFWTTAEKERRFPRMHQLFPSSKVSSKSKAEPFGRATPLTPEWTDETTLQSYMENSQIEGIIVVQNDKIRLEEYGKNANARTLWTSFSMAKSVTSMLLGIALKNGAISSLEDPLALYIPEFENEDYGKVTVRQLVTMTSGIDWNENYEDSHSDVAEMYLKPCEHRQPHIVSYMKSLKFKHSPGSFWNYSTGETDLLGILIQKATGKTLAQYLSENIWIPWGMESDAYWLEDECSGLNIGGSGLSATLRDYARIGTLMLHQGSLNQTAIFSEEWISNATRSLYATDDKGGGYGYLWWKSPSGSYRAVGIFGQMIYVNPAKKLVIAQYASWPEASSKDLTKKREDFVQAVERALK